LGELRVCVAVRPGGLRSRLNEGQLLGELRAGPRRPVPRYWTRLNEGQLLGELRVRARGGQLHRPECDASMKGSSWESCGGAVEDRATVAVDASMKGSSWESCGPLSPRPGVFGSQPQ